MKRKWLEWVAVALVASGIGAGVATVAAHRGGAPSMAVAESLNRVYHETAFCLTMLADAAPEKGDDDGIQAARVAARSAGATSAQISAVEAAGRIQGLREGAKLKAESADFTRAAAKAAADLDQSGP
jgi:hypothetical protein